MSGSAPTRRSLSSLALEGLVILASIHGAFFLEGWGADRELERDLEQELESVYRELESNLEIVQAELAVLDRVTAAASALIGELHANPAARTVSTVDTIAVLGTSWSPTIDPSLGAVQALIGSGRLAQVTNPLLRQGLAGLGDEFEDAREEQLLARAVFTDQIFPLTYDRLDYRFVGNLMDDLAGRGDSDAFSQEEMAEQPLPSRGTLDFPNTLEIRNALELRRQWYVTASGELAELETQLVTLMKIMSGELGPGGAE